MMQSAKTVALSMFMLIGTAIFASDKLISRVDISTQMVSSVPEATYRKASGVSPKVGSTNRWLIIKIEYTAARSSFKDPVLRQKKDGYYLDLSGFIDDLRVDVRVLAATGFKHENRTIYGLLTGHTELYTVRGDGKRHMIQMFIPGKMLDRCCRAPDGGVRSAATSDFAVQVVFSAGGRELAREYHGIAGGRKGFENALKMVPVNMIFDGWVLPRSQTPWALHDLDYFDVEKSQSAVGAGK